MSHRHLLLKMQGSRPQVDIGLRLTQAMTCYEILTGGVPLEGLGASDYDAVLVDRKRPKLPSNLNPKVKDFVSRCWHQDPEVRPPFKEIVVELKELHRELITGSKIFSNFLDGIFSAGFSSADIVRAGPEANLVELKTLLRALLVKYNQADCLLLCVDLVAGIEHTSLNSACSLSKNILYCHSQSILQGRRCDTVLYGGGRCIRDYMQTSSKDRKL